MFLLIGREDLAEPMTDKLKAYCPNFKHFEYILYCNNQHDCIMLLKLFSSIKTLYFTFVS